MTITQPSKEEVELLIKRSYTMYGMDTSDLALAVPTLEEVKATIAAGYKAELSIRVVKGSRFKSVRSGKDKATIQFVMEFETLTLSRITELKEEDDGAFSFVGVIRHYDNEDESFHPHGNRMIRSYSQDKYRVSHNPHLHVHSEYDKFGGGHGTEDEGDEHED